MGHALLKEKPPLGPNFLGRPKSARERAASRWFSGEKPALPVRFASDKTLPGQYFDEETGLHHNGFRTFDPSTGRYIQSDPVGLTGGLNTYGYANNNSLSFIDPDGLSPIAVPIGIGIGVLVTVAAINNSNTENGPSLPDIEFPELPKRPDEKDLICEVRQPEIPYQAPEPDGDCWGTTQIILAGCNKLSSGKAVACKAFAWGWFAACLVTGGPGGPGSPQ
jgi:RHS repeat-associated protein